MNAFERLKEIFRDFPGIGPRQSERFAYFLLSKDVSYLKNLAELIEEIKNEVVQCQMCMRFFNKKQVEKICEICNNPARDKSTMLLVARDNDLKTIESSDAYNGYYFVLGGLVPILEKEPKKRIRFSKFMDILEMRAKNGLSEIVFAFSATHEGEHTELILEAEIKALYPDIKISRLGRGISTGLEIEYSDSDTIKAALRNKK